MLASSTFMYACTYVRTYLCRQVSEVETVKNLKAEDAQLMQDIKQQNCEQKVTVLHIV